MKFFCIIILILISTACKQQENYIEYHKRINQAELKVRKGDYNSALYAYQLIFSDFEKPFYKDLHNASLCAIQECEYVLAIKFCEKLVEQGYVLSDFNENGFTPLKNTVYWSEFLERYKVLHLNYLQSLDYENRKKLYEIHVIDQIAASSGDVKLQDSIFYRNAILLDSLFLKDGFPNCNVVKDTMWFKVLVPLRHYFGLINRLKDDPKRYTGKLYDNMSLSLISLEQQFLNALEQGKILPRSYADNISYWEASNRFGKVVLKTDFNKEKVELMTWFKKDRLDTINQLRSSVGLLPFDDNYSDLLSDSWYAKYPFKEIKKAILDCDTCKTKIDYILLKSRIARKFQEQIDNKCEKIGFILTDYSAIEHTHLIGFNKLIRVKNAINNK